MVNVPPSLLALLVATLVVCVSIRSMSLNAIVPAEFSTAKKSSSVVLPVATVVIALMVGASLVPVTVTETN